MIHVGEQIDKKSLIYTENPDVLNIPRCANDPSPPDVLMVS